MKGTLTRRVLGLALVLCLALAAVMLVYQYFAFDRLYLSGVVTRYQNDLWRAVTQFGGGTAESRDPTLARFSQETGAAVAVYTDQLDFADSAFPALLPTVTVALDGGATVRLVTILLESDGDGLPLAPGDRVDLRAVRLGQSGYYEPLRLLTSRQTYLNSSARADYGPRGLLAAENLSGQGHVVAVTPPEDPALAQLAQLAYRAIRDGFIRGELSHGQLEAMSEQSLRDSQGSAVHLFHEAWEVAGESYHFVSLRYMPLTGEERSFAGPFLWGALALAGILVLAGALLLGLWLSRPLRRLVGVTDKMAGLDFAPSPESDAPDELGQLSRNIGAMSKSLETALQEFKDASDVSAQNEERMRQLLSDLAHEFKTPLGIISSHFEVLEKGYHEGNVEEYFRVLDDEISHLSEIVNEVIELSKLQSGHWRIELDGWDLPELVDTVMHKFSKQLERQGFTATWDIPEVAVRVDARRIEQVFGNLISNAMKYSDERRLLAITADAPVGDQVTVRVCNSGHLSESERERIWERYYSTGGGTKARLPSEGIGLDIVKTILVSHGSRFGVTQEGDMVCFYFSLPLDLSPAPEADE